MTHAENRAKCRRYRKMATGILGLIPHMGHSEALESLQLVAIRYERLAEHLEGRRNARGAVKPASRVPGH